ncbi:hypothetical protein [Vallitalea okinawensis]|nr:hypothetical protein [Vallitalea okinawensis]
MDKIDQQVDEEIGALFEEDEEPIKEIKTIQCPGCGASNVSNLEKL